MFFSRRQSVIISEKEYEKALTFSSEKARDFSSALKKMEDDWVLFDADEDQGDLDDRFDWELEQAEQGIEPTPWEQLDEDQREARRELWDFGWAPPHARRGALAYERTHNLPRGTARWVDPHADDLVHTPRTRALERTSERLWRGAPHRTKGKMGAGKQTIRRKSTGKYPGPERWKKYRHDERERKAWVPFEDWKAAKKAAGEWVETKSEAGSFRQRK